MGNWKIVKLSKILKESKEIALDSDADRRIRVLLNANGVMKRPLTKETEGATTYYVRKTNQFIYGKQNLHKGAFGIIPSELDGFSSSSDLPAFDIDKSCLPKWLDYFFKQGNFYLSLIDIAKGAATKRIQPNSLFEIEIPLPNVDEQRVIIENIQKKEFVHNQLTFEIEQQKQLLSQFKQAILQEAIQGKLTENWLSENTDIEPASELLKRIKAEKAKLIKEKKIKKEKELAPISKEEIPFEIPENWVWVRLGEIANVGTGATPLTSDKSYYLNGNIPWITSSATGNLFVESQEQYITEKALKETNCTINPKGTLVVAMYGQGKTRGQITELMFDSATNQACATIQPYSDFINHRRFIKLYFRKIYSEIRELAQGGAQPNLNMGKIKNTIIPLPPLSEQQAIVEKVEILMAKCTALEQEITQSEQYANMLMQAVLKESFESKNAVVESVQMDRSIQLALMQMMFKQNLGINYGEVIMQKTAYNLDHLYQKESSFFPYSYQSSNHGAFSVQLRKELESNPYLTTKSTEKGKVICVEHEHNSAVLNAFSNPVYKDYIQSLTQLLEIYSLPIIGKKSDQIELFNTVLKIMNDLNVTDIETIYAAMENWEIEQKGYKTKAQKFSLQATKKMLGFILSLKK